MCEERWFAVANLSFSRTVLVLDASDASDSVASGMLDFAADIVKEFESILDKHIYFLGNKTPFCTDKFSQSASVWRGENAGRLALIGPVFESMGKTSGVGILILTAGRIIDCEDWSNLDFWQRTTIVNFSDNQLHATAGLGQEIRPDLNQLRERISQRVTSVAIVGSDFFPIYWSNPSYRWEGNQLIADQTRDFAVNVGLLISEGSHVEAIVTLSNNMTVKCDLKPIAPSNQEGWISLPEAESQIIRNCVTKGEYACPICNDTHESRNLTCRNIPPGRLLPPSVLPMLDPYKGRGFVLFNVGQKSVAFRPHNCLHLYCPPTSSVAITRNERMNADLWNHSEASSRWEKNNERWQQFTHLGDDIYAIVL